MKKYLKGLFLILCGFLPFLFVTCVIVYESGEDKRSQVLSIIEAFSEPLPSELKDLVPPYPKSQGMDVTQFRESTTIMATTEDQPQQIEQFYADELTKRGWLQDSCGTEGEKTTCYKLNPFELSVYTSQDCTFKGYSSISISVIDTSKRFKPSKESDPVAEGILRSVAETYRTCSSYRDEGLETWHFLDARGKQDGTSTSSFTTAYQRPNRFRMVIKEDTPYESTRVIHADASGVREREDGDILKYTALWEPLCSVHGVPDLLISEEACWPLNLTELEMPDEEVVNGSLCHKIRGKDQAGDEVTLWIDKERLVLCQLSQDMVHKDFSTQSLTTWNAQVNIPLDAKELDFRPFGKIPVHLGKTIIQFTILWKALPLTAQLFCLSGACLILAGLFHIVKTWKHERAQRLEQETVTASE